MKICPVFKNSVDCQPPNPQTALDHPKGGYVQMEGMWMWPKSAIRNQRSRMKTQQSEISQRGFWLLKP